MTDRAPKRDVVGDCASSEPEVSQISDERKSAASEGVSPQTKLPAIQPPEQGSSRDPLATLRQCRAAYSALQAGHRRAVDWIFVEAYGSAIEVGNNPALWARLVADPFWTERKEGRAPKLQEFERAVYYATTYAFAPEEENDRKRTSDFAKAAEVMASEGVPPERVIAAIRACGGY